MSLEQVRAFYTKVAQDESFRSQLEAFTSKSECSELVKAAGFEFTTSEYEEYTAHLLELDGPDQEVTDLSEEDLVAVAAGFFNRPGLFRPMYGLPVRPPTKFPPFVQPIYGSPRPPMNPLR